MSEPLFFPFNAVQNPDLTWDRVFDAEDFAAYFAAFINNGVFANPVAGLRCDTVTQDFNITVRAGMAWLNGHGYNQPADQVVTLSPADSTYPRKDAIFVQLSEVDRLIQITSKTGTPGTNPVAPGVERDSDIWELKLCEITIPRGAALIQPANVLDTRPDNNVCGFVTLLPPGLDLTGITNQYQNALNTALANWINIQNQEQNLWTAQTAQQQTDWQDQTNQQQTAWQTLYDTWSALLGQLATQTFSLINNNFDDWSARPSTHVMTNRINDTNGSMIQLTETMTIDATGEVLATRFTDFTTAGFVTEIVTFNATSMNVNGNTVATLPSTRTRKTNLNTWEVSIT